MSIAKKTLGKNEISVENLLNNLFSNEEDQSETTEIPEVVKEELGEDLATAELSEEEEEILEAPVEEEEGADEEAVAEESARLSSEIGKMELAMQTAEEYVWAPKLQSTEADEVVKANILKKFWDWLVKIVEKIRVFVLTFIKRIQIWLTGDMKGITKFGKDNAQKINEALIKKGGDISLKIKLPKENLLEISITDEVPQPSLTDKAMSSLKSKKFDEALFADLDKSNKETSVKGVATRVYGDAKATAVTASQFNAVVPIVAALSDASDIKKIITAMIKDAKSATSAISTFKSLSTSDLAKEDVANLKKFAVAIQKNLNIQVTMKYWLGSAAIGQIKIAKAYATKLLNAKEAKKEEPKKEEPKK